jgi:transcriptional regulator with XRE-family HTH domain
MIGAERRRCEMNERIKELRKELRLTQQEFADELKISRGNIGAYEVGKNAPSDAVVSLICKTFNVNEDWLRSGAGNMFLELPEEDEEAAYVSELLEDVDNDLFILIKEVMHTYHDLSPKSKEVIRDFSARLRENIKKGS